MWQLTALRERPYAIGMCKQDKLVLLCTPSRLRLSWHVAAGLGICLGRGCQWPLA